MSKDIEQEQVVEQEQVEVQVPQRNHRRRKLVALGLVAVLGMGGAAYAYFTTTGSTTGNTRAGTDTPLTFTTTITPDASGLVPGGVDADVGFDAINAATNDQRVDTIHLTGVTAWTDAGHTLTATGCVTADFTVADVVASQVVPGLATTAITAHGALHFADSGINQDDCKNAYLVLSFTSN
jgi:hypothetical protein